MSKPDRIEPNRLVIVGQATLRGIFNVEEERQVADPVNDMTETAIEKTFTDTIQPATDYVASQILWTLNGLVDFSMSWFV